MRLVRFAGGALRPRKGPQCHPSDRAGARSEPDIILRFTCPIESRVFGTCVQRAAAANEMAIGLVGGGKAVSEGPRASPHARRLAAAWRAARRHPHCTMGG